MDGCIVSGCLKPTSTSNNLMCTEDLVAKLGIDKSLVIVVVGST